MNKSILSKMLNALSVSASLLSVTLLAAKPLNHDDWLHVDGNKMVDEQGIYSDTLALSTCTPYPL
ncbi:MAG: hypothetical protein ACI9LM_002708 [Alteromonadaceae bacterium]|jgi:hypothetical protein